MIFKLSQAQSIERKYHDIKSKVRSYKRTSNHVCADEELIYMDNTKPKEKDQVLSGSPINKMSDEEQEDDNNNPCNSQFLQHQNFSNLQNNFLNKLKEFKNQNRFFCLIEQLLQYTNKEKNDQETNYYFYCQKSDTNSLVSPSFREGATLTYLNGCLYLYGGLGEEIRKDIHQFDLKTKEWKKIDIKDDCYPISGMFGHTSVPYKDQQMIVYGGQSQFNTKLKARQCYNDVWSFDINKKEWQTVTGFGSIPEQRRNHSTVMKDNQMITLGGVSGNENYLNDIQIYNFDQNLQNLVNFVFNTIFQSKDQARWKNFEYDGVFQDGIAFHKLAAVFIPKSQIKSKKRSNVQTDRLKLKDEGIYCYGGKNKKGKIYSQMMVLKFVKSTPSLREDPDEWQTIQAKGKAPNPRYHHSMDYIENLNSLVIFGGIGESYNKLSSVHYNDIWIFKISTQTWAQINMGHTDNIYRSGHASCLVGSQIFFFGGIQENQYSNCFLYFIETDTLASYKLKRVNQDDRHEREEHSIDNKSSKKNIKWDNKNLQSQKTIFQNQEKQIQLLEQAKQTVNDDQFTWTKTTVRSFMPLPTKIQLKSLQPQDSITENSPYNRRMKSMSTYVGGETNRTGMPRNGSLVSTPENKVFRSPQSESKGFSKSIFKDACKSVMSMNSTMKLLPKIADNNI